jgi:hypothetical protein
MHITSTDVHTMSYYKGGNYSDENMERARELIILIGG